MTAVQEPAAGSADVHQLLAELAALRERLAHVEASAQGVEAALAYLATASVALAESLDTGATLTTLGNLIVPRLADWCAVHLADFDGSARLVSVQHLDPARAELVRDLLAGEPSRADGPAGVGAVLRSGVTAVRPQVGDDQLAAATQLTWRRCGHSVSARPSPSPLPPGATGSGRSPCSPGTGVPWARPRWHWPRSWP